MTSGGRVYEIRRELDGLVCADVVQWDAAIDGTSIRPLPHLALSVADTFDVGPWGAASFELARAILGHAYGLPYPAAAVCERFRIEVLSKINLEPGGRPYLIGLSWVETWVSVRCLDRELGRVPPGCSP